MKKDSISSDNKIFEKLNTDPWLQTSLESKEAWNIRDIINGNSKLALSIELTETSSEQDSISSDDKLVEQWDNTQLSPINNNSINAINNFDTTESSPLAAASSEVTSVPYSGQNNIDSLIYPAKWASKTITYSFFDGGSYYSNRDGNVSPLTNTIQNYLRDILENLENYIDVDFVEVSDAGNNYGQIRYMFSDDAGSAYTKVPSKYSNNPLGGDIFLEVDLKKEFEAGPGAYRYETLIHETLHALELKHPGNYNGSTNGSQSGEFLPYVEDNSNNSIMSYNRLRNTPNYSGTITPMAYDIRALQYLYGAAEYNQGDSTYQFAKIDEYTVGGKFFGNKNANSKQTLWDSGGNNTFDFSQLEFNNSGYRFDIREGGIITSQNAYLDTAYKARGDNSGKNYYATSRGTFLAYNTSINNVVNSSSDDYIIANGSANIFSGYSQDKSTGNDVIKGSNRKDTLDLSDYKVSDFTNSQNGNDLVIDLKGNGKITIDDYYTAAESDRLTIKTAGNDPTPPNPTPKDATLVWEQQNLSDEQAVATGSTFNLGNGVTATVNWQISTDGGTFVRHGGEKDFVTYDSGRLGNHKGYLSLGFDNSQDDPDDLIKLSLDFNKAVTGLNFKLLDVDQSSGKTFDDGVEIYADGINIKQISGVKIVTGDNVFADNEPYMNGFEGRGNAGVNSASEAGNIDISFGSTEVSTLEIRYFSTDDAISNPNSQKIGISDLDFQVQSA